jgi:hypothetical protein
MVGYRLYYMDKDGHILKAAEFVGMDDAEALVWAEQQWDGRFMELWSGTRRVMEFPPQSHEDGAEPDYKDSG